MNCCTCEATANHFGEAHARGDLLRYRRKGPDNTTRILLNLIKDQGQWGTTLLDVGGGVGVIPFELSDQGAERITVVDIAPTYVQMGEAEARRRGLHERVTFVQGDLVDCEAQLPQADLVTLDRVVCCYPDAQRLLSSSAAKARTWYAFSYPRDHWYVKLGSAYKNWRRRRRGDTFRTYVHPEAQLYATLLASGLERKARRRTFFWQVDIYRRTSAD